MTLRILSLIIFSVSLSAFAQISLKHGMSSSKVEESLSVGNTVEVLLAAFTSHYVIVGLGLYGTGAVIWLFVLAKLDVTTAYPFVGLGFLFTMVLGAWFLGESLTLSKVLGTLLVALGVFLVAS